MIHKLRVSSFTTTVLQFVHRPETGTISGRSANYTQTLLEKGFKKTKHTHTRIRSEKQDAFASVNSSRSKQTLACSCWCHYQMRMVSLNMTYASSAAVRCSGKTRPLSTEPGTDPDTHTHILSTHAYTHWSVFALLVLQHYSVQWSVSHTCAHTHTGTQTVYISEVQRARQPILKLAS